MLSLTGVHTAMVTPFREDGAPLDPELDLQAFEVLCERQIQAGIDGLVICGTTGETPTLSHDEWRTLVGVAVEIARQRVPITAGVGSNSTVSTLARVKEARSLGADAGLVVFPYYNKPNPAGHRAHLDALTGAGLPLVAYHVPGRTGQRLSAELLIDLTSRPEIIALKEATGDLILGSELLERGSCPLLSGDDFTFFPLMCLGGSGVISVVSNVDPAGTLAVTRAVQAGDWSAAQAAHHRLMPLVRYLFSDTNPAPCKAALASLGLCSARPRLPLAPAAAPPPDLLAALEL